ncbi:hypothetical protein FOPE_08035 [Fonsecaea pedrosoi]|nr:hypothetical protein FOPE_08035 [Fonsecaea pedrosoi]
MAELDSVEQREHDSLAQNGSSDDVKAADGSAENVGGLPPKKRRRVAKPNPDKKFECKHEGCGKSYSRAEHLYRHQLNHTPKTIYRCDYPDCSRYFVRQDLCIRHRERHTTHGSQLHKRDAFAQSTSNNQIIPAMAPQQHLGQPQTYPMAAPSVKSAQESQPLGPPQGHLIDNHHYGQQPHIANNTGSTSVASTEQRFHHPAPQNTVARPEPSVHRTSSMGSHTMSPPQKQESWSSVVRRQSFNNAEQRGEQGAYAQQAQARDRNSGQNVPPSPVRQYSGTSGPPLQPVRTQSDGTMDRNALNNGYIQAIDLASAAAYSTAGYPSAGVSRTADAAFAAAVSHGLTRNDPFPYSLLNTSMSNVDISTGFGFPVFGGDEFTQTPFAMDDFTQWLFNDAQSGSNGFSPPNYVPGYSGHDQQQAQGPYFSQSPSSSGNNYSTSAGLQHPMSVTSILDSTVTSQYIMSESKRHELLDLMQTQFVERPHDAVKKERTPCSRVTLTVTVIS